MHGTPLKKKIDWLSLFFLFAAFPALAALAAGTVYFQAFQPLLQIFDAECLCIRIKWRFYFGKVDVFIQIGSIGVGLNAYRRIAPFGRHEAAMSRIGIVRYGGFGRVGVVRYDLRLVQYSRFVDIVRYSDGFS